MNSLVEVKKSFDSMLRDFHKKLEELHGEIRDRVALVRKKLEEVAKRLEKPKRTKLDSSVTKGPRKANVSKETTTV
ncbi:hypothetical protein Q1695_006682 [Nippostrongylus brasiliensis]|nr:hypothetical protein Q1695_006682 [Nippostrongylus brasiliensis]